MKIKKWLIKIMIALCMISAIALIVVIFTGCDAQDQNANLNNYDLNLIFNDEAKTVAGNQQVDYINNSNNTLNFLMFHLYPNAFREGAKISPVSLTNEHKAYPNGKSYGNIEIESVTVSGMNCTLKLNEEDNISSPSYQITGEDKNILKVNLTKELYPGERITLNFTYTITLPNVNHRFGYGNNTVNLGNFYPIACVYDNGFKTDLYHSNGDPFYSDMANYNVKISFPTSYIAATSGEVINTSEESNLKTIECTANLVRDFAIVLSKEFKVLTSSTDGTTINYYYFSDSQPEKSLEIAVKSVETFNNLIGKYPYTSLAVVETNFVHGGMEFPNLIYISNDITDHDTYCQVIVHETAHQWWYNLVGNSEYDDAWLDEGLTEYTTALFYEINDEYNIKKETIISNAYSNYLLFIEVYGSVFNGVDSSMNRPLNEYSSEQEYVYITYVKGMLLFDTIREIIGEEKFEKCLQEYFKEFQYKNAKPEDLISCFENASNIDLSGIFESWINGTVVLLK